MPSGPRNHIPRIVSAFTFGVVGCTNLNPAFDGMSSTAEAGASTAGNDSATEGDDSGGETSAGNSTSAGSTDLPAETGNTSETSGTDDSGDTTGGLDVDLGTSTCVPGGVGFDAPLLVDTWVFSEQGTSSSICEVSPIKTLNGACNELNFGTSNDLAIFEGTLGSAIYVARFDLSKAPAGELASVTLRYFATGSAEFTGATVEAIGVATGWAEGDKNGQPALIGDSSWDCTEVTTAGCTPWPGGDPIGAQRGLLGSFLLPGGAFAGAPLPISLDLATVQAAVDGTDLYFDLMLTADGLDNASLTIRSSEDVQGNGATLRLDYCD